MHPPPWESAPLLVTPEQWVFPLKSQGQKGTFFLPSIPKSQFLSFPPRALLSQSPSLCPSHPCPVLSLVVILADLAAFLRSLPCGPHVMSPHCPCLSSCPCSDQGSSMCYPGCWHMVTVYMGSVVVLVCFRDVPHRHPCTPSRGLDAKCNVLGACGKLQVFLLTLSLVPPQPEGPFYSINLLISS